MMIVTNNKIFRKGKPLERVGRKAKGLRSYDYDSRLPHLCVWIYRILCKEQPSIANMDGFLFLIYHS